MQNGFIKYIFASAVSFNVKNNFYLQIPGKLLPVVV